MDVIAFNRRTNAQYVLVEATNSKNLLRVGTVASMEGQKKQTWLVPAADVILYTK
jgi:hypothetical protein